MSSTTMKPLPPALKALQHVLDALPSEEDSEGETETVNIRDFAVSLRFYEVNANRSPDARLVGNENFLSQG